MVTYAPHVLIAFGGRLFGTEVWSCSLRMTLFTGTVGEYPRLDTWSEENVEDIGTDVAAWFTRTGSAISSAARLDYVKVNPIGPDGRYWNQERTIERRWAAGDAPSGVNGPGLAQNTVVVSLLTDAQRGRASRGRFYPPTGALVSSASTGRISNTLTQQMADSAAVLIEGLNNQPGLDLEDPTVVVASDLGEPGPVRPVTSVAVGDVVDTQRRRRNQLPELYSVATID